jgi:TPR repeat protein
MNGWTAMKTLAPIVVVAYFVGLGFGYAAEPDLLGLLKRAENGEPSAQLELAHRYLNGKGFSPNIAEVVRWSRRAAEGGSPEGQAALAHLYEDGIGVSRDIEEAVGWYRKAAAQDSAFAIYNLAVIYADGRGVPKDSAEAARLFLQIADRSPGAAFRLISIFENGDGVPADAVAAYVWANVAVGCHVKSAVPALLRIGSKLSREELAEGDRRWPPLVEQMTKGNVYVGAPSVRLTPAPITSADALNSPRKRPEGSSSDEVTRSAK